MYQKSHLIFKRSSVRFHIWSVWTRPCFFFDHTLREISWNQILVKEDMIKEISQSAGPLTIATSVQSDRRWKTYSTSYFTELLHFGAIFSFTSLIKQCIRFSLLTIHLCYCGNIDGPIKCTVTNKENEKVYSATYVMHPPNITSSDSETMVPPWRHRACG